jgi:predicted GNAT superfamily acetyltransferase
LARGIDLIEWTFDPLQVKNAHFNIARLGAIARHYIRDLYGRTSSPLHGGLPTDRLVAEWWVRKKRVEEVLEKKPRARSGASERISVPRGIREICRDQPSAAEKIQARMRSQFESLIERGYAAVGFEFSGDEGNYVLEPYED